MNKRAERASHLEVHDGVGERALVVFHLRLVAVHVAPEDLLRQLAHALELGGPAQHSHPPDDVLRLHEAAQAVHATVVLRRPLRQHLQPLQLLGQAGDVRVLRRHLLGVVGLVPQLGRHALKAAPAPAPC
eukprot:3822105-Pyramimonas_sp.AAC.2